MAVRLTAAFLAAILLVLGAPPATSAQTAPPAALTPGPTGGYWLAQADGRVRAFGNAADDVAAAGPRLRRAVVGIARTPSANGYWVVSGNGGVGAFGDARLFGSMAGRSLSRPVVGMAATPTGKGYWLVASDGGIFAFGDARFHGSTGNIRLNKPIVGMASTRTGKGYWLVASDGGIFAFGDAPFHGSTGSLVLDQPVVSMEPVPTDSGYWLVAADGGIFSFGPGARFHGSTGGRQLNTPVVDMAVTPSGAGYWLAGVDGAVYAFGTAPFHGTAAGAVAPVVGIASPASTAWRTLLVAGDVAACDSPGDEITSSMLDGFEGTVVAPGDVVYERGTADDFAICYDPSWGRHKHRTRPAIGNHEYLSGGDPYWDYYGEDVAGVRQKGWYSFDVGSWHVVVLNSNCTRVGCEPGSEQQRWLRADLEANPALCTVAMWHHHRFSSGNFGTSNMSADLFRTLYEHEVDVLLVGHEHDYERFMELDPDGLPDPGRGVRQFVVGTGGRNLIPMRPSPILGTESRQAEAFGFLKLELDDGGYRWRFVAEPGKSFTDTGRARCH